MYLMQLTTKKQLPFPIQVPRFVHTLFNDIDVQHKMCSLFTY